MVCSITDDTRPSNRPRDNASMTLGLWMKFVTVRPGMH